MAGAAGGAGARAVLFDIGGVVVDSPLDAIARYERELGAAPGTVNRMVVSAGPEGAWSRLERGELALDDFYDAFDLELAAHAPGFSAREMMARIHAFSMPRPAVLRAIERIRRAGLRTGALTNNWETGAEDGLEPLRPLFDTIVESRVEGLRKPDPRIYELACARLRVAPPEVVFLDDIGRNLKPARALGMTTIKVAAPEAALRALERVLGLPLLEESV